MRQGAQSRRVYSNNTDHGYDENEDNKKKRSEGGSVDALLFVSFLGLPPCRLRCALPAPAGDFPNRPDPHQTCGKGGRAGEAREPLPKVLPPGEKGHGDTVGPVRALSNSGDCGGLPALRVRSNGDPSPKAARCCAFNEKAILSARNSGGGVVKQKERASSDLVYTDRDVMVAMESGNDMVRDKETPLDFDKHTKELAKGKNTDMLGSNTTEKCEVLHDINRPAVFFCTFPSCDEAQDTIRALSFKSVHVNDEAVPLTVTRATSAQSLGGCVNECDRNKQLIGDDSSRRDANSIFSLERTTPETAMCCGSNGFMPSVDQGSPRAITARTPLNVLSLHKWVRRLAFPQEVSSNRTSNTIASTATTSSYYRVPTALASVCAPLDEENEEYGEQQWCGLRKYVPRATSWGVFSLKGL